MPRLMLQIPAKIQRRCGLLAFVRLTVCNSLWQTFRGLATSLASLPTSSPTRSSIALWLKWVSDIHTMAVCLP